MTGSLPEPYATIARLRAEQHPEQDIADAVGMTRKMMWMRISRWNQRFPKNTVPKPFKYANRKTLTQSVVDLHASGVSFVEMPLRLGASKSSVYRAVHRARKSGRLPPLPRAEDTDDNGWQTWARYERKSLDLRRGALRDILKGLTPREVNALLDRAPRHGEIVLTDLILPIIKEHLNANPDAR
jgi:predicted DNA-binding transcriptional regulator AlpA